MWDRITEPGSVKPGRPGRDRRRILTAFQNRPSGGASKPAPATKPVGMQSLIALLAVVALAACWNPTSRAMRVDPLSALREE